MQTLPRRWKTSDAYTSTSTESLGGPLTPFSLDSELLTSDTVVPTQQKATQQSQKRWAQQPQDQTGSYTMIGAHIIAFPGFEDSLIGITEGEMREDEAADDTHNRDLVVKPTRNVLFSKKISLNPDDLRPLRPRIILEDGYRSRDDD